MKRDLLPLKIALAVLAVLMALAGSRIVPWIYAGYRLPPATADEVGLYWQECELSASDADIPNRELVARCFGHEWQPFDDAERTTFAVVESGVPTLTIDGDRYTTGRFSFPAPTWRWLYLWSMVDLRGYDTLYKNGQAIQTLFRGVQDLPSISSLQQIAGQAVWEFVSSEKTIIVVDGSDLRRVYGLHNAYRPYRLADKLIFVGRRFDHYFVIYNGQQIGPQFDELPIAYCCEGPLYALNEGSGRYLFRGRRHGRFYLVEISSR